MPAPPTRFCLFQGSPPSPAPPLPHPSASILWLCAAHPSRSLGGQTPTRTGWGVLWSQAGESDSHLGRGWEEEGGRKQVGCGHGSPGCIWGLGAGSAILPGSAGRAQGGYLQHWLGPVFSAWQAPRPVRDTRDQAGLRRVQRGLRRPWWLRLASPQSVLWSWLHLPAGITGPRGRMCLHPRREPATAGTHISDTKTLSFPRQRQKGAGGTEPRPQASGSGAPVQSHPLLICNTLRRQEPRDREGDQVTLPPAHFHHWPHLFLSSSQNLGQVQRLRTLRA